MPLQLLENKMEKVAIIGKGFYLKNIDSIETLSNLSMRKENENFSTPEKIINKKGLRYKDLATKFAIYAANDALLNAGVISHHNQKINSSNIAVIVCSSLGNIDTVGKVMNIINSKGVNETSPLDLPNLSPNNIAASIAIWFKLTGINLTICNGSTSSIDSIHIGCNLLQSRKAEKVLIIGVEVLNEYTQKLDHINMHSQIGAVGIVLSSFETTINFNGPYLDIASSNNCTLYDEYNIKNIITAPHTANLFLIPYELFLRNKFIGEKDKILCLDEIYGYLDGIYAILSCIYAMTVLDKYPTICIIAGNYNEKYKQIIIR